MRPTQRDGPEKPGIPFEPFLVRAVKAIVRMHDHARALGRPVEDFAFDLDDLRQLGLSNNYLRLLVSEKILKVGIEKTQSGSEHREFEWSSSLPVVFHPHSAFLMTDRGVRWSGDYFARGDAGASEKGPTPAARSDCPFWDAQEGVLWHQGKRILKICQDAYLQKPILEAFQKQGWPRFVLNPFPDPNRLHRVENLREGVKKLNQRLREHGQTLHFYVFESGEKVGWEMRANADR